MGRNYDQMIPDKLRTPCPTCTWRGPVWLDENYHCAYCNYTYQPGSDNYAWVWRVVPLEWWLEGEMIKESEIPNEVRAEGGE